MRSYVFVSIIFILGLLLRFVNLSSVPPSLSHDEAAIGYNAYSIVETGKDEYGNPFPMLFRSFDDYKLPGYIYVTAFSMSIFGINEFAVRFPSAFFGSLTVLVMYFVVKEFLKTFRREEADSWGKYLPLIAMFMLSISPWHINFSRAGFEANASFFFMAMTLYFLFLSRRSVWFLVLAAAFSIVSVYFYYTARIVLPIILITFLAINRKIYLRNIKALTVSAIVGALLIIPILPFMFSTGLSRVNQVSIFNDKSLTNPYSEAILRHDGRLDSRIIYNRRVALFQQFSDNYLKNFAPDFYFTSGLISMGPLYIWEIPFFILGILVVTRLRTKYKWVFLVWFLSVPVLGGLTVQQPNALRTLPNVLPAALFTSVGLVYFISILKNRKIMKAAAFGIVLIAAFFFIRFLYLYFDYNLYVDSKKWGDGHKQMVSYVASVEKNYDKIYITGEFWRPYAYLLFYSKYDPVKYQENGSRFEYDKYIFADADWDRRDRLLLSDANLSDLVIKRTLFILSENDYKSQKNFIDAEKRNYSINVVEQIDGIYNRNVFYAVGLE